MKAICRKCKRQYLPEKSQADYTGYCSARCLHEMARLLGYRPKMDAGHSRGFAEYDVLSRNGQIGTVTVAGPLPKEKWKALIWITLRAETEKQAMLARRTFDAYAAALAFPLPHQRAEALALVPTKIGHLESAIEREIVRTVEGLFAEEVAK